ncbi:hypothetical protein [Methylovulum psychrotolerans]|uniref:Uncharacterized protein n=1 Tax=Methylovulum psychrotolerans TaxID=1704499 RepID=A0A1Z4C4K3_9GAMM|nr:hypothetical protein [Methylovulum psychrotolerans]ASF48404.1 hypothetical protein CEK71_21365 [Methylovulum psychrotolerans]
MIVLRDPKQLARRDEPQGASASFPAPLTRAFILTVLADSLQGHFQALSGQETYAPQDHGYVVIAEPGDTAASLETETGCPILTDWFQESRYGDDGFAPSCEWLDEQPFWYEMGFTLNDNGFTVLLIVPKLTGVDSRLLQMCKDHADIPAA